jgi:hypothetical protein
MKDMGIYSRDVRFECRSEQNNPKWLRGFIQSLQTIAGTVIRLGQGQPFHIIFKSLFTNRMALRRNTARKEHIMTCGQTCLHVFLVFYLLCYLEAARFQDRLISLQCVFYSYLLLCSKHFCSCRCFRNFQRSSHEVSVIVARVDSHLDCWENTGRTFSNKFYWNSFISFRASTNE